jgi:hypothetical protein
LRARDEIVLSSPPEDVYEALLDLESYRRWWPRSFDFAVLGPLPAGTGSQLRITNQKIVWWTVRLGKLAPGREVAMDYVGGAWCGPTRWTLQPEGSGTRLAYEIDIEPAWWWLGLLGRVVPLAWVHSRQLQPVLIGLDRHLSATRQAVQRAGI